jgi:hypothetical protein
VRARNEAHEITSEAAVVDGPRDCRDRIRFCGNAHGVFYFQQLNAVSANLDLVVDPSAENQPVLAAHDRQIAGSVPARFRRILRRPESLRG